MHLTAEEQKMLDGAYGETVRRSMKVLVALGDIYGADHMIEIKNVHSPGVSYRVAGDAGLGYVEDASRDAHFQVPSPSTPSALTPRTGKRSASRRTSRASSWNCPQPTRRWGPSPPTAVPPT